MIGMRWMLAPFALTLLVTVAPGARADEAEVPGVVGMTLEAARTRIEAAGFTPAVTWSDEGEAGTVLRQDPAAQARRPEGSIVELVVARTPPPEMGEGEGEPPVETPPPAPVQPAPDAPGETPPPPPVDLSKLEPGRRPDTAGPPLPSVLGLQIEEARDALDGWTLRVERTVGIPDLEGRIVNQVPFPGTTLAKGQTATVVVAVRDMPEGHQGMPSVVGAPVDAAAARLRKAGLAPKMWALPSAPSKRGVVLTQLPLADSIVGPKDEVHLFVGVGGRPETTEGSEATPGPEEPALEPTPPETSAALGVPTLISPSEGQSFPEDYGATFQWTAVRGAQGYEWVLEREAQGGAFGPATSHRVTAPRYRPPRVARGRYRWRVRALRGDQAGPWSVWFRLFMY